MSNLKYLVPLEEDKGEDSKVSWHFGRAAYFAIVSLDTDVKFEIKPSTIEHTHHTKAGSHALYLVRSYATEAVVVKEIGQRALQVLLSAGVKVYETKANTLKDVIEEIKNNKIKTYTPASSI